MTTSTTVMRPANRTPVPQEPNPSRPAVVGLLKFPYVRIRTASLLGAIRATCFLANRFVDSPSCAVDGLHTHRHARPYPSRGSRSCRPGRRCAHHARRATTGCGGWAATRYLRRIAAGAAAWQRSGRAPTRPADSGASGAALPTRQRATTCTGAPGRAGGAVGSCPVSSAARSWATRGAGVAGRPTGSAAGCDGRAGCAACGSRRCPAALGSGDRPGRQSHGCHGRSAA